MTKTKKPAAMKRCRKKAVYRAYTPEYTLESDFCFDCFKRYSNLIVDGRYGKGNGVRCKCYVPTKAAKAWNGVK